MPRPLMPLKIRICHKNYYGLDIETKGDKKEFVSGVITSEKGKTWVFLNKRNMIDFLKTKRFKNSYIGVHNLHFDFLVLFHNEPEAKEFHRQLRGSHHLYASTHIIDKEFSYSNQTSTKKSKQSCKLTFIDTTNYAPMKLHKVGKILNMPKLDQPEFLGDREPQTHEEWEIYLTYNIVDAEICLKFLCLMRDSLEELGGSFKLTIASAAMSLFRTKYLKTTFWQFEDSDELKEIYNCYYGGRTEAFTTGKLGKRYYYDINSNYPAVMAKEVFPDPNTHRISFENSTDLIRLKEGCSLVRIRTPKQMQYPYLPKRYNKKLLFPLGVFNDWYTHVDLREAIARGYVIEKVYKTHYFLGTCAPFKDYVNDLYTLRKDLKAKKNPKEFVVKLLLNSLYGKFGEKFWGKETVVPFEQLTAKQTEVGQRPEPIDKSNNWFRVEQEEKVRAHCIPIWAAYITSYGRRLLYKYIEILQPDYVDTDSCITTKEIPCSTQLGEMKLEMEFEDCIVVRPKFYCYTYIDKDGWVRYESKIKGLQNDLIPSIAHFEEFLCNPTIAYTKWVKFKEALRRSLHPNETITMTKTFNLNDEKRDWFMKDFTLCQRSSQPLSISEEPLTFNKPQQHSMEQMRIGNN